MTNKKKTFFLRLSPGALPCTDSHIFANPLELILFSRAHQTGPILFRVKLKKIIHILFFYCNFPFNSTESERIMSFIVVHFGYTHAQTTIYSREYVEIFKRVHIFLNGLSLDLLVTLEEEKDSWIVYVCQFGAVRRKQWGIGLTAWTNTVGLGLRVCVWAICLHFSFWRRVGSKARANLT